MGVVERWKLIADVGGTNARFARSPAAGELRDLRRFNVCDFGDFVLALSAYLDETGREGYEGAAIAAAGPVADGEVKLTNCVWRISAEEVSAVLGGGPVRLVNDLEAVALALPHLSADDVRPLGGPVADLGTPATRIAINVGTGLGAAAAIPAGDTWGFAASEAGHMTFSAVHDDEMALIKSFRSVEDVLSGRGVRRLYHDISAARGEDAAAIAGDLEVFAQPATDLAGLKTREIFTRLLGRLSGDLVLASAAWGGAFLCGGVAHAWSKGADMDAFRAAFEAKGAMEERMRGVGTSLLTLPEPALYGLTFVAGRGAEARAVVRP